MTFKFCRAVRLYISVPAAPTKANYLIGKGAELDGVRRGYVFKVVLVSGNIGSTCRLECRNMLNILIDFRRLRINLCCVLYP